MAYGTLNAGTITPGSGNTLTVSEAVTFTGSISFPFMTSYYNQSVIFTGGNDVSVGNYDNSTDATERRTLNVPAIEVEIGGSSLKLASATTKDLNTSGNWDASTYATAANRAGKDFYVYATIPSSGTTADIILSNNSTLPTSIASGATPSSSNSRKIAGFHCLCVSVGTISGHDLTGYIAGDILPRSVWDLFKKPVSAPEGMVLSKDGMWVDIYLPSVSGSVLVSANGGTIAKGTSSPAFHGYKFEQWFGEIGKKLIRQTEFVVASLGANQGTNITGSADPTTTAGHSDTAGRRMISNIGCEDMAGVYWQWSRDPGGSVASAASWANAYDGNDSGIGGQHNQAPYRAHLGGGWSYGLKCGSRGSGWSDSPLALYSSFSGRAVAESKGSRF